MRRGCLTGVTKSSESHVTSRGGKRKKAYRQSGRSCKDRGNPAWTCYTWPERRDPYYTRTCEPPNQFVISHLSMRLEHPMAPLYWAEGFSLSYHCGPDLTRSLIFCLSGTAAPEATGTPTTGMCVVPCASETAAKASAVTEACNNMIAVLGGIFSKTKKRV